MIEAAVVGKSVLTVLRPEFAQESTLHFHHLLAENGGFLQVAGTLDEHVAQLETVLSDDDAELRRAFVQRFVRPHGLDRPATPILADAVEELAGVRAAPAERGSPALRAGLPVEAAPSLYAAARFPVRSWRRRQNSAWQDGRSGGLRHAAWTPNDDDRPASRHKLLYRARLEHLVPVREPRCLADQRSAKSANCSTAAPSAMRT